MNGYQIVSEFSAQQLIKSTSKDFKRFTDPVSTYVKLRRLGRLKKMIHDRDAASRMANFMRNQRPQAVTHPAVLKTLQNAI